MEKLSTSSLIMSTATDVVLLRVLAFCLLSRGILQISETAMFFCHGLSNGEKKGKTVTEKRETWDKMGLST